MLVAGYQKWEQSTGFALDTHAGVVKWVKNEHLNFAIPYRKEGIPARYIPDFIAVLDNGLNLILETSSASFIRVWMMPTAKPKQHNGG